MAICTVNGLDIYYEEWHPQGKHTLVLLHGFTGTTATWHPVIERLPNSLRIIALDLIGHGQTAAPSALALYTTAFQITLLEQLFEKLKLQSFTLLGYSLGGRVALSYACRYPERLEHLLLESASPGLELASARKERKVADDKLANRIEEHGVTAFAEQWANIPLFATQKRLPQEQQQRIHQERCGQRAIGLANSLRGIGTGVMPAQWQALPTLHMPVTLLTGALDTKFENIAKQMVNKLPKARHISFFDAGHAIHVENPVEFATIVKESFIRN